MTLSPAATLAPQRPHVMRRAKATRRTSVWMRTAAAPSKQKRAPSHFLGLNKVHNDTRSFTCGTLTNKPRSDRLCDSIFSQSESSNMSMGCDPLNLCSGINFVNLHRDFFVTHF
jgi:hypothetical protein